MNIHGIKIFAKSKGKSEESKLLNEHIKTCIINFDRFLTSMKRFRINPNENLLGNIFFSLIFHDIGKIEYNFQKQLYNEIYADEKEVEKLKDLFGVKNAPLLDHEIISLFYFDIIEQMLKRINFPFIDAEEIRKIKTAILFHHYNDFYAKSKNELENMINEHLESNKAYIESLIYFFEKNFSEIIRNFLEIIQNIKIENEETKKLLNNFKDLLQKICNSKVEYNLEDRVVRLYEISEDVFHFKLLLGFLMRIDYLSSFSQEKEIDIPPEILPKEEINIIIENAIKKLKEEKAIKKMWQESLIEFIKKDANVCLIAPTGSGKTEFAFLLNNNRKLLYTLPIRVALNDMYENRFIEYFSNEYSGLLHSTNFIEFMNFERRIKKTEILEKVNASRFLSYPFILSTADQLLLCSLGFHGHERILTVVPYSHIVIDEIQAYNTDMLSIILTSIDLFTKLGSRISIITATLPKFIKDEINNKGFKIIDVTDEKYRNFHEEIKNLKLRRHKVKIIKTEENKCIEEFKKVLNEILKKQPQKILVIFNTVKNAIDFYKSIENDKDYKQYEKILLHARILEKEKSKRINEIKSENKKFIIVATQVIEVSVNIDADIIITELSAIDSLIQRFGRVYRNRKENFNGKDPNCYVIAITKEDEIIESSNIYNKDIVKRTYEVLRKINDSEVLSYEEEKKLVENVYSDPEIEKYYKNEIQKFGEWIKYVSCETKSEAQRIFRNISSVEVCLWNELKDTTKDYLEEKIKIDGKNYKEIFEIKTDIFENSIAIPFFKYQQLYSWIEEKKKIVNRFKNIIFIEVEEDEELKKIKEYGLEGIIPVKELKENEYIIG